MILFGSPAGGRLNLSGAYGEAFGRAWLSEAGPCWAGGAGVGKASLIGPGWVRPVQAGRAWATWAQLIVGPETEAGPPLSIIAIQPVVATR